MISFDADIRDFVVESFLYHDINYELSNDIELDLLNLFTIQVKTIPIRLYNVYYSTSLRNTLRTSTKLKSEVNYLKNMFINGNDINKHQSRELFNYHVPDYLVYDWGIHHLHLSSSHDLDPYFTKRTDELLFVYIKFDNAYFLDVSKHNSYVKDIFADKKWLEIINHDWPELLKEIRNVEGLETDFSTKDRFLLRKKQINVLPENIGNRIVFPLDMGITASGHSLRALYMVDLLMQWINDNLEWINCNPSRANDFFVGKYDLTTPVKYKLIFSESLPVIIDSNSGKRLIEWQTVYSEPSY